MRFIVAILAAILLATSTASAQVGLSFTDLGVPGATNGGRYIYSGAINDNGVITVTTDNIGNLRSYQGFRLINGAYEELPPLFSESYLDVTITGPINNAGDIAGQSANGRDNVDNPLFTGVIWEGGTNVFPAGPDHPFIDDPITVDWQIGVDTNGWYVVRSGFKQYPADYFPDRPDYGPRRLNRILGFNNQGQLLASGPDQGGHSSSDYLYLFTVVPEPTNLTLAMGGGVAILVACAVRKRRAMMS